MSSFNVYIMHQDVTSIRSSQHWSTTTWFNGRREEPLFSALPNILYLEWCICLVEWVQPFTERGALLCTPLLQHSILLYERASCITFICLNINKSDTFSCLLICLEFLFCIENQTRRSRNSWLARNAIINLTSRSLKNSILGIQDYCQRCDINLTGM